MKWGYAVVCLGTSCWRRLGWLVLDDLYLIYVYRFATEEVSHSVDCYRLRTASCGAFYLQSNIPPRRLRPTAGQVIRRNWVRRNRQGHRPSSSRTRLLWSIFQTPSSRFPIFHECSFCSQDPIQDSTSQRVFVSPLVREFFRLVFADLAFSRTDEVSQNALHLGLACSSYGQTGFIGLGRQALPSGHLLPRVCTVNMTWPCWC